MAPDTRGLFGMLRPPRNVCLSKWDMLFDKDPKEWIAFKPALGLDVYPCYSCKHMFYSKKSFLDHINRRAVVLSYKCSFCVDKQVMTFYNRCAFLLHCRKHYSLEQGKINLNELEIASLPVGLAGFNKHPDIPYLFDVEEEYLTDDAFMNPQFYSPRLEDKGKEVVRLRATHLIINRCDSNGQNQSLALKQVAKNIPKCQFISLETLREIRGVLTNNQPQQLMDQAEIKMERDGGDQTVAFSSETFELHSQHTRASISSGPTSPREENLPQITLPIITKIESLDASGNESLTCPETLPIRCSECLLDLPESLASHFLGTNRPLDEQLRCGTCRLICPTACSFKAHLRIHDRRAPFTCPDCGEEFRTNESLVDHMDNICFHSFKSVRYKCPGRRCGKIFASESTFGPHFRQLHINIIYVCGVCERDFKQLEDCENHSLNHSSANILKVFICQTCSEEKMNFNTLKKHIDSHCKDLTRCMYIYMCKFCKCYFRSVATMSAHLKNCKVQKTGRRFKPIGKTNEPFMTSKYTAGQCKTCKNRIIFPKNKPTQYCNKCSEKHALPAEKCICILCKSQISFEERRQHQKECRYSKPQVVVEKLDENNIEGYVNVSSSSSSDLDACFNRPRKRTKLRKPANEPEDLTADEPIRFDGTYQCRLCDFNESNRNSFHEHAKSHRHISTAYQCMECGECFVVKPSLAKHLLHYHNVSDCEGYFRENDCFDRGAVTELAKAVKAPYLANKAKENQCRVCREQFGTPEEHDKHFRSHGMAFLMMNSI